MNEKIKLSLVCQLPEWQELAGFFTYTLMVINMILYCAEYKEIYNEIPIIDFDNSANKYLDDNGVMWNNYFTINKEPCLLNPKILSSNELDYIHHFYGIQAYPYGRGNYKHIKELYNTPYNDTINNWYFDNRKTANNIIKSYLIINENIMNKANLFWQDNLSKYDYVIGVHIRGTDKDNSIGGRKILPNEYFKYIDFLLEKNQNAVIFLATDTPSYITTFTEIYNEKCVFINDILRSNMNIFLDTSNSNNYKKGEDVLIDCLCLSKCNFLLYGSSAVSEFAIYFNMDLHYNGLNLQYDCCNYIENNNT